MKPRLLANENVPIPSVMLLRNAAFDVLAIAESNPGLSDRAVLDVAVADARWIITFDRDYGELIYARGLPPPTRAGAHSNTFLSPGGAWAVACRIADAAEPICRPVCRDRGRQHSHSPSARRLTNALKHLPPAFQRTRLF